MRVTSLGPCPALTYAARRVLTTHSLLLTCRRLAHVLQGCEQLDTAAGAGLEQLLANGCVGDDVDQEVVELAVLLQHWLLRDNYVG